MPYVFMSDSSPDVEIKKSKITGAGKGLFAKKAFKAGDFICWYYGVSLPKIMVNEKYYDSDYLYEAYDCMIDAADPLSCFGRYINDGLAKHKHNCVFAEYEFGTDSGVAHIVASRAVRKGSEFLVQYGAPFWDEAHREGLSAANIEFIEHGCVE